MGGVMNEKFPGGADAIIKEVPGGKLIIDKEER